MQHFTCLRLFPAMPLPMNPESAPANYRNKVVVLIDGTLEMHLDRTIRLNDAQRTAIAQLEDKLRLGFSAAGVRYDRPDALQCAQFAASMLPEALHQGDDSQAGLVLAMICASLPDLKQIQYRSRRSGGWDIAFVNDRSYAPDEHPIQFDAAKP